MIINVEIPVLSALIKKPKSIDLITGIITASDFEAVENRQIFLAICKLVTDGNPIDVFTITEAAGSNTQLENVIKIAKNYGEPENIIHYAKTLAEHSQIRRLNNASATIYEIASKGSGSAQERLNEAFKALNDVSAKSGDSISHGKVMVAKWADEMQSRLDRGSHIQGVETGLTELDKFTHGFGRGDLIIIAGRPSMGKTAFALSIADNVALAGKSVFIESIEMSEQKIIDRLVSRRSKVDLARIKSAQLDDSQWSKSMIAASSIASGKIAISESSNPSVFEIMSRCRRVAQVHGLDLVIIDYLQLMGGGQGENETLRIGNITRELKGMAKALGVPVVLLSQLNRGVEQRADKRPLMADLRQSGAIEQDADLIIFMYREHVYDKTKDPCTGQAIISKNRDGELGDVNLLWEGRYAAYYELPEGYIEQSGEPEKEPEYTYKSRF